jgi:N-methylhydantoinase A
VDQFEEEYERVYGQGTGYRRAGIELSTLRVRCTFELAKPTFQPMPAAKEDVSIAVKGRRDVFFGGEFVSTPIYAAQDLRSGHVFEGPAVVEGMAFTVPVHPGQRVHVDEYLNLVLTPDPLRAGDAIARDESDGRGRAQEVTTAGRGTVSA